MGSNSSTIQQKSVQTIETNATAYGSVNNNCSATISNVQYTGSCPVQFVASCYSGTQVTSDVVIESTAQAVQESLQEQSAQNGMFRFLNFNSATSIQEIEQALRTNVSNKCELNINSSTLITNLTLNLRGPCIRAVKIYAVTQSEAQCTLTTTLNIFSNADLNATTTQKSGGLGGSSGGDAGCITIILILMCVFLFLAVIMIFFFRNQRKTKIATRNEVKQARIKIPPEYQRYAKYVKYLPDKYAKQFENMESY